MAKFTVTYSGKAGGFPSFYSYEPESIVGMNNRLYTFSDGKLYGHESAEADMNNFYGEAGETSIQTIFNTQPTDNKVYKTLNLESTHPWDTTLTSDLQSTGSIEKEWYEVYENSYRAHVRDTGGDPLVPSELAMRSMNGIGKATSFGGFGPAIVLSFPMDLRVNVNVGDKLYAAAAPNFDTLFFVGDVVGSEFLPLIPTPINTVGALSTGTVPASGVEHYYMTAKNSIAESHGVTGHYGVVTLTNDSIEPIELFAVETEVMLSLT